MAEKKTTAPAAETPETKEDPWERIPFYIDRVDGQEDQEYLSVNGKNFVVPRGVRVMIPRCIVAECERSKKMKQKQYERRDKLIAESEASALAVGIIR